MGFRRVGIFHGRPTSIASQDVDAELPLDNPGVPRDPSSNHLAAVLETVQLHELLAEISKEM